MTTPAQLQARITRLLLALSRRQLADVVSRIRPGQLAAPSLDHWTGPMVEALLPLFVQITQHGGEAAIRRIVAEMGRQKRSLAEIRTKGVLMVRKAPPLPEFAFVMNPKVLEAVRSAVFAFCQSTMDTVRDGLDDALGTLRNELASGLAAGEATANLNRRVGEIFLDPLRAARVAQTEVQRAVHSGAAMADEESGVVKGHMWTSSSDACPRCLALDGKKVAIGEAFYVDPKGGAYAVCMHPPLHPFLHVRLDSDTFRRRDGRLIPEVRRRGDADLPSLAPQQERSSRADAARAVRGPEAA